MRTDSTRVAEVAAGQARDYLRTLFGKDFLAAGPQLYGTNKKNAQGAHESIRPTDPSRRPEARFCARKSCAGSTTRAS